MNIITNDDNANQQTEKIHKKFMSLRSNITGNRDILMNTNPIKFKTSSNIRNIKYITELELLPFYIPNINGLGESDNIYITINELVNDDETDFHFMCICTRQQNSMLVTPCNRYTMSDEAHRFRSNLLSVSFTLYDGTEVPLEYSFSFYESVGLSTAIINYLNEKKIHLDLQVSFVSF